ncbi:toxin co-regulated pilus biosynthesis Q family protein [Burkholderia humptydooensis]|uniref:Toxin co-regulated pilus biosynthesis Q family protein n=2 Tax=Burkholderia humptydooensis TaxID=430531 RepID=A0A7U4SUZ7_9BURK|nr:MULTISPECIES: toxin co-regulated pilus biosynthesis Q family protein [Burkholderia]AJY39499.1 toxin co-regulated pilus biosynthesis Q family protein [Burkholderia sp. 2002721687]ALX45302.1 pili assembly chaperone [Burkholderia humptydooensis]EIP85757.1 PilL domain protein [Burkholderia humptydooensis MSMB43]QPS46767.1 toxin co-regulated pilus biosynthesis Q family protein [Burkholderia humptydooensis]
MMHGATVAAAAFIAIALLATDCAASGPPAGTDPASGSSFAERFDHAPLTAPRVDVFRAPSPAASTAPSAPQPTADMSVQDMPTWDVRASDGTIRGVLSRWASTAGWQLVWDAPVDFSVDAQATLRGSFEDALQALVASLGRTSTPIQAILYRGNHVLRVVAQGAG